MDYVRAENELNPSVSYSAHQTLNVNHIFTTTRLKYERSNSLTCTVNLEPLTKRCGPRRISNAVTVTMHTTVSGETNSDNRHDDNNDINNNDDGDDADAWSVAW